MDIENLNEDIYVVDELTNDEMEETSGGADSWLAKDSAAKGYKKHCGGIRLSTSNPRISVTRLGMRIGKIDKIYVAPGSIHVTCFINGPMGGPDKIEVCRKSGTLGLVTIEAWGHQKGEPKNYRYAVLRVQFN